VNNNNRVFNFCFKGSRDYVHGTDIVSALLKSFDGENLKDLDLKFNGITSSNLSLLDGNDAESAVKVNIRVTLAGEQKVMQLVENDEKIDCRYEYDEDKIIKQTELDLGEQQIQLTKATDYTLCENFVAMNKYLLQTLYPDAEGKWYFTRLEQKKLIDDAALIRVKLIKNFNFRLVKSDIFVGDEVVGSVYFSLIKGS
jgi:hypothetical protein